MAATALAWVPFLLMLCMFVAAYSLPTTTSDDDTQEEVVTFPPSYWGDPAPNAYLQALTPYSTVWNGEPTAGDGREEEENSSDGADNGDTNATPADKKEAIITTTKLANQTKKERKQKALKTNTAQRRTKNIERFPSNTTTMDEDILGIETAKTSDDEQTKKGTDVNNHVFASLKELENDVTEFRDAMGSVAENVIEDQLDNSNNNKGEGILARRSNRVKEAIVKSRVRKAKFENQLLDFFTNYLCSVDCKK